MVWNMVKDHSDSEKGRKERKEMFYLTTHSTHFIYSYISVRHMVKDHSDSERGIPLSPQGLLFSMNSKGSFICTIPQTGKIVTKTPATITIWAIVLINK